MATSIKHYEYVLEGRKFIACTDHKPILAALKNGQKHSPKQQRELTYISQFNLEIRYIKGPQNVIADALSRDVETISIDRIFNEQQKSKDEIENLSNSSLKVRKVNMAGKAIACDDNGNVIRIIVPKSLRKEIFDSYHQIHHPSARTTLKNISREYVWPNMCSEVKEWSRLCVNCQTSKVGRHTIIPPEKIEVPRLRFKQIHIDIVGPLPESEGYRYLLTMVDRYTRWPEAIPIRSIESKTVATAFIREWISRYGCPETITTDRGLQFEASLFKELCGLLGAERIRTSSYNPRANGLVERLHRQLKSSLTAKRDRDWMTTLPIVMLGLRASIKEDLGFSPAELLFGGPLALPADLVDIHHPTSIDINAEDFIKTLRQRMQTLPETQTRASNDHRLYIPKELNEAEYVYVKKENRKGLEPQYTGPHRVISKSRHAFIVESTNGRSEVNIQKLKPARVDRHVTFNPILPRRRGRPKRGEV